jgi:hypothetical protein
MATATPAATLYNLAVPFASSVLRAFAWTYRISPLLCQIEIPLPRLTQSRALDRTYPGTCRRAIRDSARGPSALEPNRYLRGCARDRARNCGYVAPFIVPAVFAACHCLRHCFMTLCAFAVTAVPSAIAVTSATRIVLCIETSRSARFCQCTPQSWSGR